MSRGLLSRQFYLNWVNRKASGALLMFCSRGSGRFPLNFAFSHILVQFDDLLLSLIGRFLTFSLNWSIMDNNEINFISNGENLIENMRKYRIAPFVEIASEECVWSVSLTKSKRIKLSNAEQTRCVNHLSQPVLYQDTNSICIIV